MSGLGDLLARVVIDGLFGLVGRGLSGDALPRDRPKPRRPRPLLRFNPDALEARYARWASGIGLAASVTRGYRFEGHVGGRHVVFTTGLGGSAALSPELVVTVALDVVGPLLVTHRDEAKGRVEETLAELLDEQELLRSVGVTPRLVRLTFEPGTEPDVIDASRMSLEERLREVAPPDVGGAPFR